MTLMLRQTVLFLCWPAMTKQLPLCNWKVSWQPSSPVILSVFDHQRWWQQTTTAACEQGRWSLVWLEVRWWHRVCAGFCLVPFTTKHKVCTAWDRSSHQRYKLLNSWAWDYGVTFEEFNSEKAERLRKCLHLSQTEQSVCLLHATRGDLRREDQIIQDGKLAGDHPAWPWCGHFSCLVLSFATNHPVRTRQERLQFTHIWRMVTSALSMVKFTAYNQYVFFRQRTIIHFCYWRISGRDHISCDLKAEHLNCFTTGAESRRSAAEVFWTGTCVGVSRTCVSFHHVGEKGGTY